MKEMVREKTTSVWRNKDEMKGNSERFRKQQCIVALPAAQTE